MLPTLTRTVNYNTVKFYSIVITVVNYASSSKIYNRNNVYSTGHWFSFKVNKFENKIKSVHFGVAALSFFRPN